MKSALKVPATDQALPPPSSTPPSRVFRFGAFRLEAARRRLYREDELLSLSPKAMDALLVLIDRRGHVVDKDEIMEQVWPQTHVGEDSLAQCISSLRHVLGDDATHPEFVLTIPRRGYQFIAPVAETQGDVLPVPPLPEPIPPPAVATGVTASPGTRGRLVAVGIVVLAIALNSGVVFFGRSPATVSSSLQFREMPPLGGVLTGEATVSPDGQFLAYVATNGQGRAQLWLRKLSSIHPEPLAGTEGAILPFWSPDSGSIGFFADRWLKTLNVASGVVRPLTKLLLVPTGGSWSVNDQILYGTRTSPLHVIPASGGTPKAATTLDPSSQDSWHALPQFLPDGRRFLYTAATSNTVRSGVYVGSLDSPDRRRRVLDGSFDAVTYSPTGHLLYIKDRTLMGQAFDTATLSLDGPPLRFADVELPWDTEGISISMTDSLLAIAGRTTRRQLRWYDRTGRALAAVDSSTSLHTPVLSTDGTQLVASSDDARLPGIWLVDLVRGGSTRIVSDGIVPFWSRQGDRVAYSSPRRSGVLDIYVKSFSGDGADRLLLQNERGKGVTDWSADGRFLVVSMSNAQSDIDIWLLDAATGSARPWLQTPANEIQGRISPDGRWITYTSDETGRWEVYLQSFPKPGVKRVISVLGGAQPSWRADGAELYFVSLDGDITAVDVVPGTGRLGRTRPLFRAPISAADLVRRRNLYAAAPDGQRFLIDATENVDGGVASILGWRARLETE